MWWIRNDLVGSGSCWLGHPGSGSPYIKTRKFNKVYPKEQQQNFLNIVRYIKEICVCWQWQIKPLWSKILKNYTDFYVKKVGSGKSFRIRPSQKGPDPQHCKPRHNKEARHQEIPTKKRVNWLTVKRKWERRGQAVENGKQETWNMKFWKGSIQ